MVAQGFSIHQIAPELERYPARFRRWFFSTNSLLWLPMVLSFRLFIAMFAETTVSHLIFRPNKNSSADITRSILPWGSLCSSRECGDDCRVR
jgi:hypothetical protein